MNLEVLNRAEGYCQLQLWKDAWDVIDEGLYNCEKAHPEVAQIRLRIVVELSMWERGEEVADHLSEGARIEFKRTAAQYYLNRARDIYREGDHPEARRHFRKAISAWPGIDREFTDRDLVELAPEGFE